MRDESRRLLPRHNAVANVQSALCLLAQLMITDTAAAQLEHKQFAVKGVLPIQIRQILCRF